MASVSDSTSAPSSTPLNAASDSSSSAPAVTLPGHPHRERAMSKHDIGALTAPQKAALTLMREKIRSSPTGKGDTATEYTHLRFLRARKFDVPQTTQRHPQHPNTTASVTSLTTLCPLTLPTHRPLFYGALCCGPSGSVDRWTLQWICISRHWSVLQIQTHHRTHRTPIPLLGPRTVLTWCSTG